MKTKLSILSVIIVVLIATLGGFAGTQNDSTDDAYVLTIKAYKLGYLKGRLAQLESAIMGDKTDIKMDAKASTLEYIKQIDLGKEYYKYADD